MGGLRGYMAEHGHHWLDSWAVAYSLLPLIFEVETGPGLTEDDVLASAPAVRKVVFAQ